MYLVTRLTGRVRWQMWTDLLAASAGRLEIPSLSGT